MPSAGKNNLRSRREKKIALIEKINLRRRDPAETWGREMRLGGSPSAELTEATSYLGEVEALRMLSS